MARFDPLKALKDAPPAARLKKGSVFDHPRIREWVKAWLSSGESVSFPWMAEQIKIGAKMEGIALKGQVTTSNLHRWVREGNGRDLLEAAGGEVRSVRRAKP